MTDAGPTLEQVFGPPCKASRHDSIEYIDVRMGENRELRRIMVVTRGKKMDKGISDDRGWTPDRVARLGFLIGRELPAKDIAQSMGSTETAVRRQAARMGLRFSDSRWPRLRTFELLAKAKGISYDRFVERFLGIVDKEPTLVINLLDES